MKERMLLMGPPSAGKTYQLIKIYQAVTDMGVGCYVIDLEDKFEAAILGNELPLPNLFNVTVEWEEYQEAIDKISLPPDSWILVDRVDLSWPMVQRWFTQKKYEEELAERMMKKALEMKKPSMFIPRFDQGSWQVINEAYESIMLKLLYRSRCNVVMTAGIRGIEDSNPRDILGHLGIAPRGQKELPHQPHSAFLLDVKKRGKDLAWYITTAKDLQNRKWFDGEECFDFYIQYVFEYWKGGVG